MPKLHPWLFFIVILLPSTAQAECSWNYTKTFFSCDNLGISNTVGRSVASLSDIIQLNPAALPSLPTPIGVEGTYSSRVDYATGSRLKASVIKGFKGFGIGIATWDDQGFSRASLSEYFVGTEKEADYGRYLNRTSWRTGYQTGISAQVPMGFLDEYFRIRLGGSVGMAALSTRLSSSYGAVLDARWVHLSYSMQYENIEDSLPLVRTGTLSVGIQYESLFLGYTNIDWRSDQMIITPSYVLGFPIATERSSTGLYSLRYGDSEWTALAALKTFRDSLGVSRSQASFSLYRQFGEHFSLGYIYGLYRHTSSVSARLFL